MNLKLDSDCYGYTSITNSILLQVETSQVECDSCEIIIFACDPDVFVVSLNDKLAKTGWNGGLVKDDLRGSAWS